MVRLAVCSFGFRVRVSLVSLRDRVSLRVRVSLRF